MLGTSFSFGFPVSPIFRLVSGRQKTSQKMGASHEHTDSTGSSDSELCSGLLLTLIDLGWMLLEMLIVPCEISKKIQKASRHKFPKKFKKHHVMSSLCLHSCFYAFFSFFTGVSSPFFGGEYFPWNFARFLESRRHNNSAGPWAHLFDKHPNPRHLDGKKWKMWGLRHDKQVSLGFCSREWKEWQDLGCSGHLKEANHELAVWVKFNGTCSFELLDPRILSSHPLDLFIDPSRKNHPSYIQ